MKTLVIQSMRKEIFSNDCLQSVPALRIYSPASPLYCEQCGKEIFGEKVDEEDGSFCCNLCAMEALTRQRMAEDDHWSAAYRRFYETYSARNQRLA